MGSGSVMVALLAIIQKYLSFPVNISHLLDLADTCMTENGPVQGLGKEHWEAPG